MVVKWRGIVVYVIAAKTDWLTLLGFTQPKSLRLSVYRRNKYAPALGSYRRGECVSILASLHHVE